MSERVEWYTTFAIATATAGNTAMKVSSNESEKRSKTFPLLCGLFKRIIGYYIAIFVKLRNLIQ